MKFRNKNNIPSYFLSFLLSFFPPHIYWGIISAKSIWIKKHKMTQLKSLSNFPSNMRTHKSQLYSIINWCPQLSHRQVHKQNLIQWGETARNLHSSGIFVWTSRCHKILAMCSLYNHLFSFRLCHKTRSDLHLPLFSFFLWVLLSALSHKHD